MNPVYRPKIFVGTEPASLKEMTLAYTAIPNGGSRPQDIYYLDRIEDEDGQLIWESNQAIETRNNAGKPGAMPHLRRSGHRPAGRESQG